MNGMYQHPGDQRRIDEGHLNLLAIFHFVGAGLAALGVLGLFAHYAIFSSVIRNPALWKNNHQPMPGPPPEQIFAMLKIVYAVIGAWFVVSLVLNLISGVFLRARKYRTFSLVVAGIDCVHIPLGTTLGVFTFIVLLRDSVAELYQEKL